jgi:Peptidase M16 inactive domain.
MQAVIVVGDVDVDRTEAKIQEIFSVIPKCENPQPKAHLSIPDHDEPRVGVLTDPERANPSITMVWHSEATPEIYNSTSLAPTEDLIEVMIQLVMQERFADITSKPDSPYLNAQLAFSSLTYEDIDAVDGEVALKEDNILDGFKAFYTELERMKRFGFGDDEVARAKQQIQTIFDNQVKQAPTRRNTEFIRPLISHSLTTIPSWSLRWNSSSRTRSWASSMPRSCRPSPKRFLPTTTSSSSIPVLRRKASPPRPRSRFSPPSKR